MSEKQFIIEVIDGPMEGKSISCSCLPNNYFTIGREKNNALSLNIDAMVSRVHLEVNVQKNALQIKNLSETNKVWIDDLQIDTGNKMNYHVDHDQYILMGSTILHVYQSENTDNQYFESNSNSNCNINLIDKFSPDLFEIWDRIITENYYYYCDINILYKTIIKQNLIKNEKYPHIKKLQKYNFLPLKICKIFERPQLCYDNPKQQGLLLSPKLKHIFSELYNKKTIDIIDIINAIIFEGKSTVAEYMMLDSLFMHHYVPEFHYYTLLKYADCYNEKTIKLLSLFLTENELERYDYQDFNKIQKEHLLLHNLKSLNNGMAASIYLFQTITDQIIPILKNDIQAKINKTFDKYSNKDSNKNFSSLLEEIKAGIDNAFDYRIIKQNLRKTCRNFLNHNCS